MFNSSVVVHLIDENSGKRGVSDDSSFDYINLITIFKNLFIGDYVLTHINLPLNLLVKTLRFNQFTQNQIAKVLIFQRININ